MNKKESKIQIYYVGSNDSLISRIYIDNLIKFLKTNKKFELKYIINTELKNRSYITKLRKKLILLIYFFLHINYIYEKEEIMKKKIAIFVKIFL